jgi:uncharacterized damage-inducible protein DinB
MRLQPGDYAPYAISYINLVPGEDLLQAFELITEMSFRYLDKIPEDKGSHSYATGKWTIKQLLQHIIDAERVFSYRALWFARNDKSPLPGFDENTWADTATAEHRSLQALVNEFKAVRAASLALYQSFTEEELNRAGITNDHRVTVRAYGYILLGHNLHHLNILKERYLIQSIA